MTARDLVTYGTLIRDQFHHDLAKRRKRDICRSLSSLNKVCCGND
jgi:hypothetical protein